MLIMQFSDEINRSIQLLPTPWVSAFSRAQALWTWLQGHPIIVYTPLVVGSGWSICSCQRLKPLRKPQCHFHHELVMFIVAKEMKKYSVAAGILLHIWIYLLSQRIMTKILILLVLHGKKKWAFQNVFGNSDAFAWQTMLVFNGFC